MTGQARARQPGGQAPRVVEVRLSGEREDIEAVAAVLAAAGNGIEIIRRTGPRANRFDPGIRVYVTLRISEEGQR